MVKKTKKNKKRRKRKKQKKTKKKQKKEKKKKKKTIFFHLLLTYFFDLFDLLLTYFLKINDIVTHHNESNARIQIFIKINTKDIGCLSCKMLTRLCPFVFSLLL